MNPITLTVESELLAVLRCCCGHGLTQNLAGDVDVRDKKWVAPADPPDPADLGAWKTNTCVYLHYVVRISRVLFSELRFVLLLYLT